MLQLRVKSEVRKRFLSGKSDLKLELRLSAAPDQQIPIALLLEHILKRAPEIIPPLTKKEIRQENNKTIYLIKNVRGRPEESFSEMQIRSTSKDKREEEFFLSDGTLFVPPQTLKEFPANVDALETIPFQYRVNSRFDHFSERGEIVHRVHTNASQVVGKLLPADAFIRLTKALPLRLERVRLGFENFHTAFLGPQLGLIPSIRQRFYLEMDSQGLVVLAEEEKAPRGQLLPLGSSPIFEALDITLEELGLYTGLRAEIAHVAH